MKIIVACECSGAVREAFLARGHDAVSCDLKPAEDGSSNHIQGDIFSVLANARFDMMIFHWPCTRLCNSGVLRLYIGGKKENGIDAGKWSDMKQSARNFRRLLDWPGIPLKCGENPIPHGYARAIMGDYTQTIQPYEFGADASKNTALWLRGLNTLVTDPADYVKPRLVCPHCSQTSTYDAAFKTGCSFCGCEAGLLRPRWSNQTDSGQNKLAPSETRSADRARTYPGIARAMAEQWGK